MNPNSFQVENLITLALVFFVSLVLAVIFTPLADRLARKLGIMDPPGTRKIHKSSVSLLGGLAMALALFLTLISLVQWSSEMQAFLTGAAIVTAIGLLDDQRGLGPGIKFTGQITAVVIFLLLGGDLLRNLGNILGTGDLELGFFAPWLTVLGMVGLINAFNLSDGLDGLAAGLAGIACIFLIPFAYAQENWTFLLVLTSLFGAILGFLRYNSFPARIFMGDAGSLFLGFCLAAAAVSLADPAAAAKDYRPVTALIIFSLPIADTLYVMFRRLLHGQNPSRGDRSHLHHRLLDIGLGHQLSVSLLYGLMFLTGVAAWSMRPLPEHVQFFALLGFYLTLYIFLYVCEQKRKDRASFQARQVSKLSMRPLKGLYGFLIRHTKKIAAIIFVLFSLPVLAVNPSGTYTAPYQFFLIIFTVIYYPWRGGTRHMSLAQGLVFFNLFSLILIYNLYFAGIDLFALWIITLAATALTAAVLRMGSLKRLMLILPGSFEFLLLGVAITVPVLLHYFVFVDLVFRYILFKSFLLSLCFVVFHKVYLRNKPGHNLMVILLLLAAHSTIMIRPL